MISSLQGIEKYSKNDAPSEDLIFNKFELFGNRYNFLKTHPTQKLGTLQFGIKIQTLEQNGIISFADLITRSPNDIKDLPSMGWKSVEKMVSSLDAFERAFIVNDRPDFEKFSKNLGKQFFKANTDTGYFWLTNIN